MQIVRFFFVACFIGTAGISSCGAFSWATNSTEQGTPLSPAVPARSSKTPSVAETADFPVKPVTVPEAMQEAVQAVATENATDVAGENDFSQSAPAQKPTTQNATQARTASEKEAPVTVPTPHVTPQKNGTIANTASTQNGTRRSGVSAQNGTRTTQPAPKKRLSGEWVQMEPGSRPAYVGIQGGTAPISLFKSSNGMVFAFTGQTGNDFVEVLRGSNVNGSRSETTDKQKTAAKEAQQQAVASSANPAQSNATAQVAATLAATAANGTVKPAPALKVPAAATAPAPKAAQQDSASANATASAAPMQHNASAAGAQNATVPSAAATPIPAKVAQRAPLTNSTRVTVTPAPKITSNATTTTAVTPPAPQAKDGKVTEAAPAPATVAQKAPQQKPAPQAAPVVATPQKTAATAPSATQPAPDAPVSEGETVIFASGELASAMKGNEGEELLPFGLNNPDPEAALLLARGNLTEQEVPRPKFKPLKLQSYTTTVFGTGSL